MKSLFAYFFYRKSKWAWRESNSRQTRFRKPPLYPTELQTRNNIFNFNTIGTAPLADLLVLSSDKPTPPA